MADLPAYCVNQVFEPAPPQTLRFDRHYLLYSSAGAVRFEIGGRSWSLPPSRAAWIAADAPILVTIAQPVTCCSVLYAPGFIPAPPDPCKVFAVSPLAREMLLECRRWGPDIETLDTEAARFFLSLADICRRLATAPSLSWVPTGESVALRRAITFTEAHLDQPLGFDAVAAHANVSARTLARRFAAEAGMTWRQVQRRMRMVRAAELLADGPMPVTEVALTVGFASLSAFEASFRDFTGSSPREWRATL